MTFRPEDPIVRRPVHARRGKVATSAAVLTPGALGGGEMPRHGWLPVTIPGAARGWADLHARYGPRVTSRWC